MMAWRSSHTGFRDDEEWLRSFPKPSWSKQAWVPRRVEFDAYSGRLASSHSKHRSS